MTKEYDDRRFYVLKRLVTTPGPLNFQDFGYLCGPETFKNMAARGLIKVAITISPRGMEDFERGVVLRAKRERIKKQRGRSSTKIVILEAAE